MKKIGVSFTLTNYENYINWFTASDLGEAVSIVELSFEKNNYADIYDCDGFVLTGGVDVHPSLFDGEKEYANSTAAFQLERDLFEAYIYHYAIANKIPVLGICRGLQLINVLEGGKLIQDLGVEKNKAHRKDEGIDKAHEVVLAEDSLLQQIIGEKKIAVNSAHHQAIDSSQLGHNLLANACSNPDNIIEGIEFKNKSGLGFMLAVQWHPERIPSVQQNEISINIKKSFIQAVMQTEIEKLEIINPATEAIITSVPIDNEKTLTEKLLKLQSGQKKWAQKPLAERIAVLQQFSILLKEEIEILAHTLTEEVGKPLQQSRNEINGAIARISWLTDNASKYLQNEVMTSTDYLEEIIAYEPLGIVCNISAWNYPYLVGTNVFVPALLAGNAVFYKPSEFATLTGLHIERLLKNAGVPADTFQVAIGTGAVGAQLLQMPLQGYFFTGSYKTGQYIYAQVAPKMVVCQCELGGKDPIYITDDIENIASVAAGTAEGAFYNNGQSCCSVERIYVHENVYERFVKEFVQEVKSWKIGDPTEAGIYIGPLSRKSQIAFLEEQVQDAVSKGGTILTGGYKIEGEGYYFSPTVLVNVTHEMSVMKEESFGPIIGIMKVSNDEEAITLMQDTAYGLTAGVYSTTRSRAMEILERMNAGSAYWNCCDRVSASLPWSGRGNSGFGATLSHAGIRTFTKPKGYHLRKK
jgi:acyl-CoA reductase-like NAD-dependent aldehyde dehydrogenase/gamma-glutamyl-gamma-aminobutyrate hydrolase PuuD